MKFCKNLQKVADLCNPEWSPFWTDYKKLKKIIKGLSAIALEDEENEKPKTSQQTPSQTQYSTPPSRMSSSSSPLVVVATSARSSSTSSGQQQKEGDRTTEAISPPEVTTSAAATGATTNKQRRTLPHRSNDSIRTTPGEAVFFKFLHGEFQKAVRFFDKAVEEFSIREDRVSEGIAIVKAQYRWELWTMIAKAVYRLYTDLLLLETFCIMTYCSFSKILKKHDKVTGFETRTAFMNNVVNKANFTNYTTLQEMIGRCERLYSEVSARMVQEGQQGLYEDERLFIEMVQQLNHQQA